MRLVIKRTDGTMTDLEVTPAIEVAFERAHKGGFGKVFREQEKQEHLYWLAWECLRRSGTTVPPFDDTFLDTLVSVDIEDSHPNG